MLSGWSIPQFRRPFCGLAFSQMLTLYTTPVVYLYLDRFRLWWEQVRHGGQWRRAVPESPEA